MKTAETEGGTPSSGASERGGRGRGGGKSTAARGRGRGDQRGAGSSSSSSSGGRGGNHGRQPRQPANNGKQRAQNKHQGGRPRSSSDGGGRGRGRPPSSCQSEVVKKSGPYAHLFSSERHAFALSRVLYPRSDDKFILPSNPKEEISRSQKILATDAQFESWWEAVKVVRCLVRYYESEEESNKSAERCPICLDEEMVSPFIAPCGHTFCLPCVLGYLSSVTSDLNGESDKLHKTKSKVKGACGVVGGCINPASRAAVTSVRARCPMCSSGSSSELNAGDPMITYKDLRPVVFAPALAITAAFVGAPKGAKGNKGSNQSNNIPRKGTRMKLSKLHRVKSCPSPYLPLHGKSVRGIPISSESSSDQLPDLPDGDDDVEECIYSRIYFVGLHEYEDILQRNLKDLNKYREETVHCQLDPRENWNVSMAIQAVQAAQRRWSGSNGGGEGFQAMELEAKSAAFINKTNNEQLTAETIEADEEDKLPAKKKNAALLQPGSFHLRKILDTNSPQERLDEFLYYQSSDGQLCFLSGINVACLMHEFSLHKETDDNGAGIDEAKAGARKSLPLPDELSGTVVDIEQFAVTSALIKRKPFLSYIPLGSSVSFVEIDFYSGGEKGNQPMLSQRTLAKFRGELQRRKSERISAAKREEKADKAARARSERDEQRRRRELLGSDYAEGNRQQTINPDDEFFRAPAASFDETLEVAGQDSSTTFQFSRVCAANGAFPELSSGTVSSPVLTPTAPAIVPASPPRINTTWGSRKPSIAPAVSPTVNNFPSLSESANATKQPQSRGRAKSSNR